MTYLLDTLAKLTALELYERWATECERSADGADDMHVRQMGIGDWDIAAADLRAARDLLRRAARAERWDPAPLLCDVAVVCLHGLPVSEPCFGCEILRWAA